MYIYIYIYIKYIYTINRVVFSSFYGPSAKCADHENKDGKKRGSITCRLLYGFINYSRKGTKSFDVLTSYQELEVRTATYGPEVDQSQHVKSVSQIINSHYLLDRAVHCQSLNNQVKSPIKTRRTC